MRTRVTANTETFHAVQVFVLEWTDIYKSRENEKKCWKLNFRKNMDYKIMVKILKKYVMLCYVLQRKFG